MSKTDGCVSIGADLRQLDRWIERALLDIRNVQGYSRQSDLSRRLDSAEKTLQMALEKVRDYTEVMAREGSSNNEDTNNGEPTRL